MCKELKEGQYGQNIVSDGSNNMRYLRCAGWARLCRALNESQDKEFGSYSKNQGGINSLKKGIYITCFTI